jgi:hypothetical protein
MTATVEAFIPLPYTFAPDASAMPAPPAPDRYRIVEGMSEADRGYIVRTWTDSFHRARANYKLPLGVWKHRQRAAIERVLALPGTRVLVAHHSTPHVYQDGRDAGPSVLGWIVWTTGQGWPTVHYAYTRHALGGVEWRRRGVLSELVEAAELGRRVVYTHRGESARGSLKARQHYPRGLDEEIADWARGNGVAVAYVPLEEWIR